jgi:hypothetical protein
MVIGMGLIIAAAAASLSGSPATSTTLACLRAITPTAAGGVPSLRDFEPALCHGKPTRAFRFDAAARSMRAIHSIQGGDLVAPWPNARPDAVRPGDRLSLKVAIGAVMIEREVRALQSASPGESLFVRDSDGNILSIRYEGGSR